MSNNVKIWSVTEAARYIDGRVVEILPEEIKYQSHGRPLMVSVEDYINLRGELVKALTLLDTYNSETTDNLDKECYLTAGELKKQLKDVPDDTPVCYQRIEDMYFENGGWATEEYEQNSYDGPSDYIRAFQSFYLEDENVFIVDAHY